MKKAIFLLIFLPILSFGQNTIGLPDISNFNKFTYLAGTQSWDIKQDKNGIIYFANNEGLLCYDGKYWNLYPLPNKTIVRSIEIGPDDNIYIGGQDEMGYFSPNESGNLEYHSLTSTLPQKDRSFGDLWDVICIKENIFFRSNNKIFKITGKSASVYNAPNEWLFCGTCDEEIYAQDSKEGILVFRNNIWMPLNSSNAIPFNEPVTGVLPHPKGTIFTTLKNGIFLQSGNQLSRLNSPDLTYISSQRIYSATQINNDRIALGTNNGGVFIIDNNGKLIQHFTKKEGLQNNNVLSIFRDKQENLWLGLDNGIDCIIYNSAIKHINPTEQEGSGYAAIIFNNKLYIGTSGGLYSTPLQAEKDLSFSKGTFNPVNNATGQTWSLSEINGKLLLGHHEGAFLVEGDNASLINAEAGYWNFLPMSSVFPTSQIVSGYYKGLRIFNYGNSGFSAGTKIPDFIETSRYVAIDKYENIWVSHPYHGLFKISSNAKGTYAVKTYTDKNGLPLLLNNHVYKIKNEILIGTEKGVYTYNYNKDIFEPSEFYKKILGDQSIRYLKEDSEGNIWFIHEKDLGVIDISGKTPRVIYMPELKNKMLSGFEFIYPVNISNIFLGGEKGFYHINYEKYKKSDAPIHVHLRSVKINNVKDSTLFGGYFSGVNDIQQQNLKNKPDVNYNWRNIRFEFAATVFGQESNLQYSFRLKGIEKDWSDWNGKTEKEYTNLSSGNYTFEVKARNNLGKESEIVSYSFYLLPPWYRSYWAYAFYFFLIIIGIYYLYSWQRKKFFLQQERYEEEQKKQHYLHQLEIHNAENELIALRNEKLQSEIDFKNSELATSAMHLVQKSELLSKLKTELNQIMKAVDNEKAAGELKKMIKVLGEDDKMDKEWEHFAQHFDKVHSDFMVLLKEKHPNITPNELKLCTYLRMNLSTKEIAQLMNISVRGIEISRYRLRKKLGISTETSLFDYLINLNSKNS